jgi:hypothetical protein
MDLARVVYSRDLKIAVMLGGLRLDNRGSRTEASTNPKLIERWRGEWRAKAEDRPVNDGE